MRARMTSHLLCISISAPTNILIIPIMALFITIRMLYGKGKVKTTPEKMPYPVRTRVRTPTIHKKIVVKGGLLFSTLKLSTYSMNSRHEFLNVRNGENLQPKKELIRIVE